MGRRSYAMRQIQRGCGSDANSLVRVLVTVPLLFVLPLALGEIIGGFRPPTPPDPKPPVASPELLAEIRADTLRDQAALDIPHPQMLRERALAEEATRAHEQQMAVLDAQMIQERESAMESTRLHNQRMTELEGVATSPASGVSFDQGQPPQPQPQP